MEPHRGGGQVFVIGTERWHVEMDVRAETTTMGDGTVVISRWVADVVATPVPGRPR